MRRYDRVVGTFFRKINKLEKIYEKNRTKIHKLLNKADRIKERIEKRISKLEAKNDMLAEEAAACKSTSKKLSDLLS